MILQTPRLKTVPGWLGASDLIDTSCSVLFFCNGALSQHIKIPAADSYWGEASTRQWPDESGLRVFVQLDENGFPRFALRKSANLSGELYGNLVSFLRKFGCKPGGPAKTIYFRLLYED